MADPPLPFLSCGSLPSPGLVQQSVDEAYSRYLANPEGENSQVYPALARVPSDLFGMDLFVSSPHI